MVGWSQNMMIIYVDGVVFEPVVRGGAALDVVDEYREYYYSNGGERLEQIINEWRTDG